MNNLKFELIVANFARLAEVCKGGHFTLFSLL